MDSLTYTFVIPQPMMSLRGQLVDGAFDDHNGGKPNGNGFGLLAIRRGRRQRLQGLVARAVFWRPF